MNISQKTLKDLHAMADLFRANIVENSVKLQSTEVVIAAAREMIALQGYLSPGGTFAQARVDLIQDILLVGGPMHRKEILRHVKARGVTFKGSTPELAQLSMYLNRAPNAHSTGNGMWELLDAGKEELKSKRREEAHRAA